MNPYNPDNEQSETWGGIVIAGNSPVYDFSYGNEYVGVTTTNSAGWVYGGNQADYSNAHNSGSISYVHIKNAGNSPTHNETGEAALKLFATSGNFNVSNIHIENSTNEGLSVIGGNTNLKNLIISGAFEGHFDASGGWSGSAQNVIIDINGNTGNNSNGVTVEGIGDGITNSGFDYNSVSNGVTPVLTNFTIMKGVDASPNSSGLYFTNDAKVNVLNTIIAFDDQGLGYENGHIYFEEQDFVNSENEPLVYFNGVLLQGKSGDPVSSFVNNIIASEECNAYVFNSRKCNKFYC